MASSSSLSSSDESTKSKNSQSELSGAKAEAQKIQRNFNRFFAYKSKAKKIRLNVLFDGKKFLKLSGNNSPQVVDLTSEDDYAAPTGWKYRLIELAVPSSNEISATRSGTNTSSESEVEGMRRSVPTNSPTARNDMTGAGHSLVSIEQIRYMSKTDQLKAREEQRRADLIAQEEALRGQAVTQLKARLAQRRAVLIAQEEALRVHVADREKRTEFLDFLEMPKRRSRFAFFANFFVDKVTGIAPFAEFCEEKGIVPKQLIPSGDSGCQLEKVGEDGKLFIEPHGPQCRCAVIPEVGPTEDAQSEMKRSDGRVEQNEAQEHRARFKEFCDSWSNADQLTFDTEFKKAKKDFTVIQLALPHKTVAEIVQYYYWRKVLLINTGQKKSKRRLR